MWKLKGCNRCGGDVYIDRDLYGWYEACLQCGKRVELPQVAGPGHKFAGTKSGASREVKITEQVAG